MAKNPLPSENLKQWFIKYRLQNGLEGCYPLFASEKEDLWNRLPKICEDKGLNFFEFDSKTHRILIQSSQLIFFRFLFEPLYNNASPDPDNSQDTDEEDASSYAVKVYFTDNPTPIVFHVDEDEPDCKDEGNEGEMNNFIYYALNAHEGEDLLHFTDEDGEVSFFKGSNIALVEIPLKVLQAERLLNDA